MGWKTQILVDDSSVPKGMWKVLVERGIDTERMNAQDMRIILSHHDDFKREQTVVEKYLSDRGHMVLFIRKFHCELNPIERVWGQAKVFTRKFTNFTFKHLREIINPSLDSVSVDTIRKYYRKGEEYENVYREGKAAGKEVSLVKTNTFITFLSVLAQLR